MWNSTISPPLSASTYEYRTSFRSGNLETYFVLHQKLSEPIVRLASHSQYIYLQISTVTLFLCPSRDCIRSSFFPGFILETKTMDTTVHCAWKNTAYTMP